MPDESGVLVFETSAVPIEPYWQEASMRFELMYTGFADRLLKPLGYDAIIRTAGLEPARYDLEDRCFIHLDYARISTSERT